MDSWKENYFLTGDTQDQIHFRSIGKMIQLSKQGVKFLMTSTVEVTS